MQNKFNTFLLSPAQFYSLLIYFVHKIAGVCVYVCRKLLLHLGTGMMSLFSLNY